MTTGASIAHFDSLFDGAADPWGTRTRWYERRKRALLLAALPLERYAHAFEPGCGAGETTVALAQRCDRVTASDASLAAVRQARERLGRVSNVQLAQGFMPHDWPTAPVDLVVFAELGYYLSSSELRIVVDACRRSLGDDGTLVACHWRRPASDLRQRAEDVHAAFAAGCGLQRAAHYADADFLLDVWSADVRSVAQREGLA